MAWIPQEPGQGSLHFSLIQAKLLEHSELTTHSGRQLGGAPMYWRKQEHEGLPPMSRHSLLGPQGDGMHGFLITIGGCSGGGAEYTCEFIEYVFVTVGKLLRGIGKHLVNGSPVCPGEQAQTGLWLMTEQWALRPHVPGQGSWHFWLMQALFWAHSELTVHSGLQPGGDPMYVGRQEQTACPLISRHWLLGPQGDGWQGLVGVTMAVDIDQNIVRFLKSLLIKCKQLS